MIGSGSARVARFRLAAAAAVALLAAAAATPAPAQDAAGDPPPAGETPRPVEDPVAEARRLHAEAKPFFRRSGDTDLSQEERRAARKEAYTRLKEARRLLDEWIDAHPEDAERLDDLHGDIAKMTFWLKKEAAIGELEGVKPRYEPPPPPAPPAAPAAPASAPPTAPEPPRGPTAAEVLEEIRAYEKRFPGDVPGHHEKYAKFLADFPDRSSAEFAAAAARLEALDRELKDAYRLLRDDDPDAIQGVDEMQVVALVKELAADLEHADEPVRERAARFLGGLGSGTAAPPLLQALRRTKDAPGPFQDALVEALAKIGGRRVTTALLREKPDSPMGPVVLKVLVAIVGRGGVSARIAGEALASYAEKMDLPSQQTAVAALRAAGRDGAPGLALAIELAPDGEKADIARALGELGDPRAAGPLARVLVVNPAGSRARLHRAARESILRLGKPAVRHLIPVLDQKDFAVWTAELLREITGVRQKDDRRRTWETWYRANRKSLEGP